MKEARATLASHAELAQRKDQADQADRELAQLEAHQKELQEKLNELNQQINEQGFQQGNAPPRPGNNNLAQRGFGQQLINQRDMIKANLNEMAMVQKTRKSQASDKKTFDEEIKKSTETAKALLAELRPMVDEVTNRYVSLGADADVKSAFSAMEKSGQGSFKLGPSEAFKSAVRTLDQAERLLLGKKSALPRKKTRSRK